ncbi:MAG: hypothetical protein CVT62_11855 [Actinobacteria bacterium HGW-Actinobacteria-2]|nr:MAG: hypothetical protein CVT62_11855 [Actinobacteria bacterium HGW-Actinobacteria-2]
MSDFSSPGPAFGVAVASPPEPPAYPDIVGSPAEWLRSLDWRGFEDLVGRAYRFQGYDVLPTAIGADGGIDLILTRGTERIFVQCKHWRSQQVGVKVIRELYGLVAAHGATWGIVATSGTFTVEAEEFARTTRITLLDGHAVAQLVALAREPGPAEGPPLNLPSPVPEPANLHIDPSCPICSAPMALRTARRGPRAGSRFWGCTRYPGCKGVRPAPQSAPRPRLSRARRFLISTVGATVCLGMIFGAIQLASHIVISTFTGPMTSQEQPVAAAGSFGEKPVDVAYDASAKQLYSANTASGDVTVADATTLKPIRTIDVPGKPVAVAADSARHLLFVADGGAKKVYVIDARNGHAVGTMMTTAKPTDLAIDPSRQRLYVVSETGGSVESFNTATRTRLGSRTVSGRPSAVAVDPTSHRVYIAATLITVHSGATLNRIHTLPVLGGADALALDPGKHRIYLTRHSTVEEYSLTTHATRQFTVTDAPGGLAINPTKHQAYLAIPGKDAVVAISIK